MALKALYCLLKKNSAKVLWVSNAYKIKHGNNKAELQSGNMLE
jgi:hypothetical protein